MAKTAKQIQSDVYTLLRDSNLYSKITGEVYRNGLRPRDSGKEDAVVIFTTGTPDEIQTGVVTVNIFVPDLALDNGVWIEDMERTAQLELSAQEWADSLSCEVSCYRFQLQQTIYTEVEPETHEHFVVIKLRYRFYGDDCEPLRVPQPSVVSREENGYDHVFVTEDNAAIEIPSVIRDADY